MAALEDKWAQLVSNASHVCMPTCATGQLAMDEHALVALGMHRWYEAAILLATFQWLHAHLCWMAQARDM